MMTKHKKNSGFDGFLRIRCRKSLKLRYETIAAKRSEQVQPGQRPITASDVAREALELAAGQLETNGRKAA